MISSMTGFGEITAEVDGTVYSVEIRTVNNRHLKAYVRLPEKAAFLNDPIEKMIRNELSRGTVNYSLRMHNISSQADVEIDKNTLKGYIDNLKDIATETGLQENIDLAVLLTLPGAVQEITPSEEVAEKLKTVILDLTSKAIDKLKEMRAQEGIDLADDLLANCRILKEKTDQVHSNSTDTVELYHEKLKKRVDELLANAKLKIDSDLLAREVAIFAERSDIAEETTRLNSHLKQFEKACKGNENVGRRLDFISQEMLRETNTIGSKALNASISNLVIDMKCIIDRIKEQVQNVE
ncbi:MAG: YicC family protein [Planctomycetes bacterium]|nr:YicC family protein [Planctomycetota bacterium]